MKMDYMTLYYVKLWHGDQVYYKIGRTTRTVKERFANEPQLHVIVLFAITFEYKIALKYERRLLRDYPAFKVAPGILKYGGFSEVYSKDILELDTVKIYR